MKKKILIAGASGLVGTAAVKLFAGSPDWEVVAVSRRAPFVPLGKARHIPVDLLNEAQCREVFGAMSDVTHIAYCAVNEQEGNMVAGWQDPIQAGKNMAMLRNVFDPLIAVAKDFRHISLVHGMKAYGSHIWDRVMPIPFVESLPRIPHENFYYHQEDYCRAKQAGQDWGWTIFRPAMIAGEAIGSNMNSYLVLGVFAALRKEAGLPLPQPAGASMVTDVTDADLIADGLKWAAESPQRPQRFLQPDQRRRLLAAQRLPHRRRRPEDGIGRAAGIPDHRRAGKAAAALARHGPQIRASGAGEPESAVR